MKPTTTKDSLVLKAIKYLGKKAKARLIDANQPEAIFAELVKYKHTGSDTPNLIGNDFLPYVINHPHKSQSQLYQDFFVLFQTKEKRNGFFVEFGATNGLSLSNTYLLEKEYDWKGIVAEPAIKWHQALRNNRSCIIETDCVWKKTGQSLTFHEVDEGELSSISTISSKDRHATKRDNFKEYQVQSISLQDMLGKHDAPRDIDFLSIDTEGSELEILNAFDFNSYNIKIITVEHNYTDDRQEIYALLSRNGYQRLWESFSLWDDWYIKI